MRGSTWIERGPDGRPYYVKRGPALPSIRQTIAEAIHDIRQRNPFFNKDSTVSAPASTQPHAAPSSAPQPDADAQKPGSSLKQKSQPQPETAERSRTPGQPPSQTQPPPQPQHYHFRGFPSFAPPSIGHGNNQAITQALNSTAMIPSHLLHYTAPHPRMYPYVPAGTQALVTQPPLQRNNNAQPPVQAPFGQTFQQAPPGHVGMTPAPVNTNDLRPKCSNCGCFRSARYQWKHRVAAGQLPPPNICRRCRKEATDSEDESTDSYEARDYRRQSRNRCRSRSRASRLRSRARSASIIGHQAIDFDYYADRQLSSSSDSNASEDLRPGRRRSRRRRARSPSVDVIRYVDVPARSKSRKRMTVYVEDYRSSQEASDEGDTDVRYVRYPSRKRIITRPGTPASRSLVHQQPSPDIRAPIVVERREYYEADDPPHQIRHVASHSGMRPGTPYRVTRSDSPDERDYDGGAYATRDDDDDHINVSDGDRARRARIRGGGRNRGRSRSHSRLRIDESAELGQHETLATRVPSPVDRRRRRTSSLAYVDSAELDKHPSRHYDAYERSLSRRRRRRRVPDEETALADDYEWYDKDGMRVRVREI